MRAMRALISTKTNPKGFKILAGGRRRAASGAPPETVAPFIAPEGCQMDRVRAKLFKYFASYGTPARVNSSINSSVNDFSRWCASCAAM